MDDDFDDFDEFNDAADDWELEAAEEEAREKELLEQKANLERQKLQRRVKAPARAAEEAEREDILDKDIMQAILDMKEKASSAAEARTLMGNDNSTLTLIADMPVNTKEEAMAVGEAIAARVLEFARSQHFNALIGAVFHDFAREFTSRNTMSAEALKVHVASEEAKRRVKKAKKTKGGRHECDVAANEVAAEEEPNSHDALNFHEVVDKGGATDFADDGDFM